MKRPVHWCRVVMNQEIEKFIRSLDCPHIDALEISGAGSQGKYNFRSYRTVQYPDYDVCRAPLAEEQFDLVIAEQVFEHVLRPDLAAANVYKMLRPGGGFVISTPFLLKVHGAPLDFSLDRARDATIAGNGGPFRHVYCFLGQPGMPARRHDARPRLDLVRPPATQPPQRAAIRDCRLGLRREAKIGVRSDL
jgi:SAM-dependent methyltransferase